MASPTTIANTGGITDPVLLVMAADAKLPLINIKGEFPKDREVNTFIERHWDLPDDAEVVYLEDENDSDEDGEVADTSLTSIIKEFERVKQLVTRACVDSGKLLQCWNG